jgi:hypothetical protein
MSVRVPKTECPKCKQPLDGATSMERDYGPKTGDVSLCYYCATLLIYDDDLTQRKPTPEELKEIGKDHYTMLMLAIGREKIKQRNAQRPN